MISGQSILPIANYDATLIPNLPNPPNLPNCDDMRCCNITKPRDLVLILLPTTALLLPRNRPAFCTSAFTTADWIKLFKQHFKFTGSEITHEFLMSTGYLKGVHPENGPLYRVVLEGKPWWSTGNLP